jgi:hypothetical protein
MLDSNPWFRHDCNQCTYLGKSTFDGEIRDMYACKREGPLGASLISRYGHDGHEYESAPLCVVINAIGEMQRADRPGPTSLKAVLEAYVKDMSPADRGAALTGAQYRLIPALQWYPIMAEVRAALQIAANTQVDVAAFQVCNHLSAYFDLLREQRLTGGDLPNYLQVRVNVRGNPQKLTIDVLDEKRRVCAGL